MANHPNRSPFPFRVGLPGQRPIGGFADLPTAGTYAQWASKLPIYADRALAIDVTHAGNVVGSYLRGVLQQ